MTLVFVPNEAATGETRVAATSATVRRLIQEGFSVLIERGAGVGSLNTDTDYQVAGAELCAEAADGFSRAQIILMVNPPSTEQIEQFALSSSLITHLVAVRDDHLLPSLATRKISAFSMNFVPRISRSQKMDSLSSQSNLSGYRAVIIAAAESPKIFPLMMTAAGTIKPARVVVLGAGVAGLQAIATARRLGAVVEVSDVRPVVKEQVETLGATYIEVPNSPDLAGVGGYAKEASAEFLAQQQKITGERIKEADVVITTALVPGKKAPRLISKELVELMRPGSVIVDLAAEQGGNCELTLAGKVVVTPGGVKIVGSLNLAGDLAVNASEMYSRNVLNVLLDQCRKSNDAAQSLDFSWNLDDEIVAAALVVHQGEVRQGS